MVVNPPIERTLEAYHQRIITNRASRRQIIDKTRRQRYVAIRGIQFALVTGAPFGFPRIPASAAIDLKTPSVHPPFDDF